MAHLIDIALMIALFVIGWVALVIVLATRGQTPGKAVVGLRVLKADGDAASASQFLRRELLFKELIGVATFELSSILGAAQLLWDGRPWWDRVGTFAVVERAAAYA